MNGILKVNEFKKAVVIGSKAQDEFIIYNSRIDSLDNK